MSASTATSQPHGPSLAALFADPTGSWLESVPRASQGFLARRAARKRWKQAGRRAKALHRITLAQGMEEGGQAFLQTALALSDRVAARLPEALTGPIRRGDSQTVERHLDALSAIPEARELYRVLGRRILDLAKTMNDRPSDVALEAISRLLRPAGSR